MTEGDKVQCPYCEKVLSSATGLDPHLHEANFDKTSDLHWPENAFYINEAEEEKTRPCFGALLNYNVGILAGP